jgi:predicted DNA-binding helix-hairpin-helix protein
MSVPGIGAKVADKILELREAKGDLELDDLNQVPYLRITQPLLEIPIQIVPSRSTN